MKILQINCVYDKGSTGKITADLHHGILETGDDSVVCYGRGKAVEENNVYKTCPEWYSKINNAFTRINGIMYGGCVFSTYYLIAKIKKERPDIVHLQCINGYFVNIYRLLNWLKKQKIKTVLTLHAEFMYTGGCAYSLSCNKWEEQEGCGYSGCPRWKQETNSLFKDRTKIMWKKMKLAFEDFDTIKVIAVSRWIENRARVSPIMKKCDIRTIYNGIRLGCFDYKRNKSDVNILHKYGINAGKKIVLHVTPSYDNPVKGGEYFKRLVETLDDNFTFIVVGAKRQISEKIISIPFTNNQDELAVLYRNANVFVITSKADNYPTVCLEANCCGTPVVGFDVGGVKETIFPGMGEVVEFGNIERLHDAVEKWSEETINENVIIDCRKRNSCQRMTDDYRDLYNFILNP